MDVFVTGGAGFIGSHLCEYLLNKGNKVIGIDNFDPYYPKSVKIRNLENFIDHPNFEFHDLDIETLTSDPHLFNRPIDTIIHLAAKGGVRPSFSDPEKYITNNILTTVKLLEFSKERNIKNFIYGSSSSVYGNNDDLPLIEGGITNQPISPYAASKLSSELFTYVYHNRYGLNVTNLRFFTVYGPRQRPEMAIHKFINLIDKGEKLLLFGSGNSTRDYTYIDDIVEGIDLAIQSINGFNTYNLGSQTSISLSNLIELIANKLGKKAIYDKIDDQPGDVSHTLSDISKARQEIGYHPKVDLDEGLDYFIKWYKDNQIEE